MIRESNAGKKGQSFLEPDHVLIELLARGDDRALARLFERHSRLVYGIALRVLRSPAAAEDVLQEVFLQLWRNPGKFQPVRGGLSSWLAVVSRNRAIDVLRGIRDTDPIEDIPLESNSDLAKEAEQHILMGRVREAVMLLPEDQRQALELSFFDGFTHTEIAEKLNHPLGTVKTRIRAALQKLEEALSA